MGGLEKIRIKTKEATLGSEAPTMVLVAREIRVLTLEFATLIMDLGETAPLSDRIALVMSIYVKYPLSAIPALAT